MQGEHELKQEIRIHADHTDVFKLELWRDAFKHWQDKIWAGCFYKGMLRSEKTNIVGNAIIDLRTTKKGPAGKVYASIMFNSKTGLYHAEGHGEPLSFADEDLVLRPKSTRAEFENAIARFVRNRDIKGVVLPLSNPTAVRFLHFGSQNGYIQIGTK